MSSVSGDSDVLGHDDESASDAEPDASDSDPDGEPEDDPDPEYHPSDSDDDDDETISKKSVPVSLLREVAKTQASYRICEKLLKVGVKINDGISRHYSLSKTNLWSQITKIRHDQRVNNLHKLASSNGQIVIQFDGKRCHMLNARHLGREERLIVLCHIEQCDIALGFMKLPSHTFVQQKLWN